jgi:glycerate 2-kinase
VGSTSNNLDEAAALARGARKDVLLAASAALAAADPGILVEKAVRVSGSKLTAGDRRIDLRSFRRVFVVGGGKASGLMAVAAERMLRDWIEDGVVIVPEYQTRLPPLARIKYEPSTHPLPSEKGARAVRKMLDVAGRAGEGDLVVCLISGGGSALMPLPVEGVSLNDLRDTTKLLLNAGAEITEMNSVRKHLSQIAGGRLVQRLGGAEVISLIISDVVGDDPGSIASGPTVPDPTTFAEAEGMLRRREIWKRVPSSVRRIIDLGAKGKAAETPKPDSPLFAKVSNLVVGSNVVACSAARTFLRKKGYRVSSFVGDVTGEARDVGSNLARLALSWSGDERRAAVWGGETTVTVRGKGLGGRNQEVVLAAAIGLHGGAATVVSFGTDGIDGPTDAAGAICDATTLGRAEALGLKPSLFLEQNDSHAFFDALRDLVLTGPTGTNVNDVMIMVGGRD